MESRGYPIGGYGGGGSDCIDIKLSSDDDLDAEFITPRFLPGDYTVTLRGDWYLEELKGGRADRIEKAVLLSPQSQYAYLGDGWSQTIYFAFGIDGDIIDFRSGTLNIGIQVEKPGDHNCQPAGGGWGGAGGNICNVSGSGGGCVVSAPRGETGGTSG